MRNVIIFTSSKNKWNIINLYRENTWRTIERKKTHKHKSKNGNLQVNSKNNNNKQTKQDAIFSKNQCQQIRVDWDPAWNLNHSKKINRMSTKTKRSRSMRSHKRNSYWYGSQHDDTELFIRFYT